MKKKLQPNYDNESRIRHLILALFLGLSESEYRAGVPPKKYNGERITTQTELADAIAKISYNQYKPSQSGISKALDELRSDTIKYRQKIYRIGKVDGIYNLLTKEQYIDWCKDELNALQPFLSSSVFCLNPLPTDLSTIYGFKVYSSYIEDVEKYFKVILEDACFEILIQDSLLIILLDAKSKNFKEAARWLRDYFK